MKEIQVKLLTIPAPVEEIASVLDSENNLDTIRLKAKIAGKDLVEYFPTLKRVVNRKEKTKTNTEKVSGDQESQSDDEEEQDSSKPTVDIRDHEGNKLPVMTPEECSSAEQDRELNLDQSNHIDGTNVIDPEQHFDERPKGLRKGTKRKAETPQSKSPNTNPNLKSSDKPHSDGSKKRKKPKRGSVIPTLTKGKTGDRSSLMDKHLPKGNKRPKLAANDPSANTSDKSTRQTRPPQSSSDDENQDDITKADGPSEQEQDQLVQHWQDSDTREKIREDEEAVRLYEKGITTCGHHAWSYFCKAIHNKMGQLPTDKRHL